MRGCLFGMLCLLASCAEIAGGMVGQAVGNALVGAVVDGVAGDRSPQPETDAAEEHDAFLWLASDDGDRWSRCVRTAQREQPTSPALHVIPGETVAGARARDLTQAAIYAVRHGSCASYPMQLERVRAVDAGYFEAIFLRDPELAKCHCLLVVGLPFAMRVRDP